MSISFEQAMGTLQNMFQGADRSVIQMVLESNGGHMERTVEQLLSMNLPMSGGDPSEAPPAGGQLPPSQSASSVGSRSGRRLDPSQTLADDFLRPPSYFKERVGKRQTRSQVEEDAILAALLQDQMFMEDIRRNPEVYGFRRGQQPPRRGHPAAAPAAAAPAPDTATANAGDDAEEEQKDGEKKKTFKEKWNSLTDAAKRKFAALSNRLSKNAKNKEKPSDSNYMVLPAMDDDIHDSNFEIGDDEEDFVAEPGDIELEDRRINNAAESDA